MPFGFNHPVAATWAYVLDDPDYDTIPKFYHKMDFTKCDVLYVAPVGLQLQTGTFDLADPTQGGLGDTRFKFVIDKARSDNKNIVIIASQWWGAGSNTWGYSLDKLTTDEAVAKYAASVATFVQKWGIQGYDIDYESQNTGAPSLKVLQQVHASLATLSQSTGQKYYVTVSPDKQYNLKGAGATFDYLNMQNYAGGADTPVQDFLDIGLTADRLLYGSDPEEQEAEDCVDRVKEQYNNYKNPGFAGIHVWRLNSNKDRIDFELQVFSTLADFVHSGK